MKVHSWLAAIIAMSGNIAMAAVPPAIAVGDDFKLVLTAKATGVQIYGCSDKSGALAWALTAPEATLFDASGKVIGRHYGGPSWELTDGSLVTGALVKSDPGPASGAIPWLLVKVASNNGKGMLAAAQMIQRIETEGGVAPAKACAAGDIARVPYSATYQFYAAKS